MRVSKVLRSLFWEAFSKDPNILASILGAPLYGNSQVRSFDKCCLEEHQLQHMVEWRGRLSDGVLGRRDRAVGTGVWEE